MHEIQIRLLKLARAGRLDGKSLREIRLLLKDEGLHAQTIRHHLQQLARRGFIRYDSRRRLVGPVMRERPRGTSLLSIPLLGLASAGSATVFADQNIEGYLRVSSKLVHHNIGKDLFAIRAVGNSMNRAKAGRTRKTIDDGDYVIVDSNDRIARHGDYVLSVIDDVANIKRFARDPKNRQVMLLSDSTEDYKPIFIHRDDKYLINGKVVEVIKKPKVTFG